MGRYDLKWKDGGPKKVHRLVWESVHGPIPKGYDIHHIDGNGHNNNIENLQLIPKGKNISKHAAYIRSMRQHGTCAMYDSGCRCEACKEVKRIMNAKNHVKYKRTINMNKRFRRRDMVAILV